MIIAVDTSEQLPYRFEGIKSEEPYVVERVSLDTGDYQTTRDEKIKSAKEFRVMGNEEACVIERKSLTDLYGTLTRGRERFERELLRMTNFGYAAIVIEASWEMISNPNAHMQYPTQANPRSIIASLLAYSQRYNVHLFALPGRESAERFAFRIMERWFRDRCPY